LEEEQQQQQVDPWMMDASPRSSTATTTAAPFNPKRKKTSDGWMLHIEGCNIPLDYKLPCTNDRPRAHKLHIRLGTYISSA
jgi:hypothetical protein